MPHNSGDFPEKSLKIPQQSFTYRHSMLRPSNQAVEPSKPRLAASYSRCTEQPIHELQHLGLPEMPARLPGPEVVVVEICA